MGCASREGIKIDYIKCIQKPRIVKPSLLIRVNSFFLQCLHFWTLNCDHLVFSLAHARQLSQYNTALEYFMTTILQCDLLRMPSIHSFMIIFVQWWFRSFLTFERSKVILQKYMKKQTVHHIIQAAHWNCCAEPIWVYPDHYTNTLCLVWK